MRLNDERIVDFRKAMGAPLSRMQACSGFLPGRTYSVTRDPAGSQLRLVVTVKLWTRRALMVFVKVSSTCEKELGYPFRSRAFQRELVYVLKTTKQNESRRRGKNNSIHPFHRLPKAETFPGNADSPARSFVNK